MRRASWVALTLLFSVPPLLDYVSGGFEWRDFFAGYVWGGAFVFSIGKVTSQNTGTALHSAMSQNTGTARHPEQDT